MLLFPFVLAAIGLGAFIMCGGPMAAVALGLALDTIPTESASTVVITLYVIVAGAVTLVCTVTTCKAIARTLRWRWYLDMAEDAVFCEHCDYDLRGTPHGRCPECGAPLADAQTTGPPTDPIA
jgi:uncharacterized paraquat-inducible protein A